MLKGGRPEPWCQPEEELASQEETLSNSVNLSDSLTEQTRAKAGTTVGHWWAEPCLDQDSLELHAPLPHQN